MKELTGAEAIMSNGTSGNINNVDYSLKEAPKRKPGEQIQTVTESVSQAALDAWKSIEYRPGVTLAMAEAEIELAVRKPSAEDVARAKQVLAAAKELKSLAEIYARETVLLAEFPPTVRLKLQAIRVGEVGIVAIPCEVFVEIGLELKRRSPLKPTFTIELANGYNGYLPTEAQHNLGGYETWRARSSYLEVAAARKITEGILELFGRLQKT
jgi:hypothetical protein